MQSVVNAIPDSGQWLPWLQALGVIVTAVMSLLNYLEQRRARKERERFDAFKWRIAETVGAIERDLRNHELEHARREMSAWHRHL